MKPTFMLLLATCWLFPPTSVLAQPGTLDLTFGDSGKVVYLDPGYTVRPHELLAVNDTQLLAVGERFSGFGSQLLMLGYRTDGRTDSSFGAQNLTGTLTWGWPGIVYTDVPGSNREHAYAAALQADGKILVGGSARTSTDWLLVRYHPEGSIDSSFGTDGMVLQDWGGFDELGFLAVLADGKILAGGTANDLAMARFDSNGTLDPTYGSNGLGSLGVLGASRGGAAVDGQGRAYLSGIDGNGHYVLGRLTADGQADPAFGNNGVASIPSTEFPSHAYVALSPGGKVLLVGDDPSNFGQNSNLLLAQFDLDGTLDPAFGSGGTRSVALGSYVSPRRVLVQPDGAIVVAGGVTENGARDMFVAKFRPDGSLDAGFGLGGYVVSGLVEPASSNFLYAQSLLLQADGRLVLGGSGRTSGLDELILIRYQNTVGFPVAREAAALDRLQSYPNPARDAITVALPAGETGYLRLRDLHGRLVQEVTLRAASPTYRLAVRDLPAGGYLLEWQGKSYRTGKMWKE